jgi:hypothetical protein
MKRAFKKKSSIYQFLEPYLASGNEETIDKARKEYWKKYSAEWRNSQRKQLKHYMIDFTPSEAKQVSETARKHKLSTTAFIKKSCFSYMSLRYLPVDAFGIHQISQLLAMNYNMLSKLLNENIVQYQPGQVLLQEMSRLEQKVNAELRNPKTLEQLVTETVQANPQYLETLELVLKNLKT